jgi:hypothetical protein
VRKKYSFDRFTFFGEETIWTPEIAGDENG